MAGRVSIRAIIITVEGRRLMLRTINLLGFVTLIFVGFPSLTRANGEREFVPSALHAQNSIDWAEMTVKVIDADGNPVVGAKVRPWALRAGNGHGWWDESTYGSPRTTQTADSGTSTVAFPHSVTGGLNDVHVVVQVSMVFSHPDFCSKNVHLDIPKPDQPQVPQVTLERGVRLRVAGVEPGQERPLSHCHLFLENGDTGEPDFELQPDNWLKSAPLRDDRRWYRIVRAAPHEPPQFSKPRAWNPEDPASLEALVPVFPGVRVVGKISDNVARPIVRGHVVVRCGSPAPRNEDGQKKQSRAIWWMDYQPIAADGTFEFSSLPSGFLAQFYAFANDSISTQPTPESYETCCKWFAVENDKRNDFFRNGQILRLVGAKSEIVLEMEPAGKVRVKCVDPAGQPVAGIQVGSWPNQYTVGAGSTIFCMPFSSLEMLRAGSRYRFDWRRGHPYFEKTNDQGEAVIRNLPAGTQSFVASHDLWYSKQEYQANSTPESISEVTIALERKP